MRLLLQSQWKEDVQVELVSFGIHVLDREDEAQGSASDPPAELDGLALVAGPSGSTRSTWTSAHSA